MTSGDRPRRRAARRHPSAPGGDAALRRRVRAAVEALLEQAERLIAALDALDGDCDLEPEEDCCDARDDDPARGDRASGAVWPGRSATRADRAPEPPPRLWSGAGRPAATARGVPRSGAARPAVRQAPAHPLSSGGRGAAERSDVLDRDGAPRP